MTDETRPGYAERMGMQALSTRDAAIFASQILATTEPYLPCPVEELAVLDIGSGYGPGARELARVCRVVVGIEPTAEPFAASTELAEGVDNLEFRRAGVGELEEISAFDLVVLDNVYEHLADQRDALARIDRALRPGGVVYMLMPNKLWPVEVHYGLPFLGWLPLRLANVYLRLSRRGDDYTDASYAPTLGGLRRELDRVGWEWRLTLPAHPGSTHLGSPLHYRLGMRLLRRFPHLWWISKSFLVIAQPARGGGDRDGGGGR